LPEEYVLLPQSFSETFGSFLRHIFSASGSTGFL